MDNKALLNTIYDILAQNPVTDAEKAAVLELVEYVDTGEMELVFNRGGKRFALQLNEWNKEQ